MSQKVPGDPAIDKEFQEYLKTTKTWTHKRLDNIAAPLLKKAITENTALQGRLIAAIMTNLEQQGGAIKGELRQHKQHK
ncbi:MAG: hypothetical protein JRD89_01895 [Deltaproteobacteria bacterium]|nr:hypothetical protein [Deltaproteobacteria bacterium]